MTFASALPALLASGLDLGAPSRGSLRGFLPLSDLPAKGFSPWTLTKSLSFSSGPSKGALSTQPKSGPPAFPDKGMERTDFFRKLQVCQGDPVTAPPTALRRKSVSSPARSSPCLPLQPGLSPLPSLPLHSGC